MAPRYATISTTPALVVRHGVEPCLTGCKPVVPPLHSRTDRDVRSRTLTNRFEGDCAVHYTTSLTPPVGIEPTPPALTGRHTTIMLERQMPISGLEPLSCPVFSEADSLYPKSARATGGICTHTRGFTVHDAAITPQSPQMAMGGGIAPPPRCLGPQISSRVGFNSSLVLRVSPFSSLVLYYSANPSRGLGGIRTRN